MQYQRYRWNGYDTNSKPPDLRVEQMPNGPPEKFFTEMQGIDPNNVAYAQDEYGRPFIIIRDQKKMRIKGLEAQKVLISDLVAHFSSQSYYFNLEDIFGASRYWKLM